MALNYNIKPKFNQNYTNNTIHLSLEFNDNQIETTATIGFIKDGDAGTNGTKYSSIITINGKAYDNNNEINSPNLRIAYDIDKNEQFYYWDYENNKWFLNSENTKRSFEIGVKVYSDGEELAEGKFSCSYSFF